METTPGNAGACGGAVAKELPSGGRQCQRLSQRTGRGGHHRDWPTSVISRSDLSFLTTPGTPSTFDDSRKHLGESRCCQAARDCLSRGARPRGNRLPGEKYRWEYGFGDGDIAGGAGEDMVKAARRDGAPALHLPGYEGHAALCVHHNEGAVVLQRKLRGVHDACEQGSQGGT